jgi:RNA polymerase sigma factor (sigma-70 family)
MDTVTPMEVLAARSSEHVQFVQSHFFRKLSREDCADAVQDAFLAASSSEVCAALDVAQLDAWLKRAAYNKALDILRGPDREGRGAVRRHRTDIDALAELLAADEPRDPGDDDDVVAIKEAFAKLPTLDQRVIGLRHHDNLPREACAELLGMTVTKFKRAHTRAVQRLINLVVETRPYDSCAETRGLIHLSVADLLDEVSAARRDAHIAGCPHCRQYQRRSRGLLVFLPLPALAFSDRLLARLHGLADRLIPAAQVSDAATATGGAGALGAGGAKLAALVTAGAVAVGGGAAIKHAAPSHTPKARAAVGASPRQAPSSGAVSFASAVQRSYAARSAPLRSATTSSAGGSAASAKSRAAVSASAAGELKPPGHEVSPTATTTLPIIPAHTAATTTSAHTTTTSAPAPVPTPTSPDSSSGEFAPHP